jgi:uncharacterized protein YodC (DUF2158 family)
VLLEPVPDAKKESLRDLFARMDGMGADPLFPEGRKGADLVAAMQASPYNEIGLEPERGPMAELKQGVVVRLKSGGPLMTVEGTAGGFLEDGQIRCQWFFRETLHNEVFHRECLAPAGISENFEERLERLRKQSNEFNAQQDKRSKDVGQD